MTDEVVMTPMPESVAPEAPAPAPEAPAKAGRSTKARGTLEAQALEVCNEYVTGQLVLEEGKFLTPNVISRVIHERNGSVGNAPSPGAIADNLTRWAAIGFCTLNDKPKAFIDYTDAGRNLGLAAMKAAARPPKAEKAAAPVAAAPVAEGVPADAVAVDVPVDPSPVAVADGPAPVETQTLTEVDPFAAPPAVVEDTEVFVQPNEQAEGSDEYRNG